MAQQLIRLTSGIEGLDSMIQGGFPFPSTILVEGGAGTGKTTFGMQFLSEGARKGEHGLYITTLSESVQWMLKFVSNFDFINQDHFGKEITYLDLGPQLRNIEGAQELLDIIDSSIIEIMPQRVVIDPITVVKDIIPNEYRTFLFDLSTMMKNWQSTTLLTGELIKDLPSWEAAYVTDGVIRLYNELENMKRKNFLEILKMRGTAHEKGLHPFEINAAGIQIFHAD